MLRSTSLIFSILCYCRQMSIGLEVRARHAIPVFFIVGSFDAKSVLSTACSTLCVGWVWRSSFSLATYPLSRRRLDAVGLSLLGKKLIVTLAVSGRTMLRNAHHSASRDNNRPQVPPCTLNAMGLAVARCKPPRRSITRGRNVE